MWGERELKKAREIDSEDFKISHVEMCSRTRSHMILSGDNKRNQTCFLCLEEKHSGKKWLIRWSFEKISSGQSSQLSLEASACSTGRPLYVFVFTMRIYEGYE